jgi:hypothetical protein
MKRWLDLALVALFGLGLALPTIASLWSHPKGRWLPEGRSLARVPEWKDDPSLWQEYRQQLETYYGDHFGCREPWIAFDLLVKRSWLSEMGPNVLAGRGGWFYLQRDGGIDAISDCLGVTHFTLGRLKELQGRLEERRDWLAARGIKYVYVIVPNKESIYPEFLPEWLKPSGTTKVDQFVNYMHLHSTVAVLDLRPGLRQARQRDAIYYKTDSHWNLMGALVAGEEIISQQSRQIPGLVPLSVDAFHRQPTPGTEGDLVRMAGDPEVVEDNDPVLVPGTNLPSLQFSSSGTNAVGWPPIWNIPVPENLNVTTIKNPQLTQSLVIFGDSFAVKLQPFLGYHFGQVILSREPFNPDLVLRSQPVLVMDEVVERLLF